MFRRLLTRGNRFSTGTASSSRLDIVLKYLTSDLEHCLQRARQENAAIDPISDLFKSGNDEAVLKAWKAATATDTIISSATISSQQVICAVLSAHKLNRRKEVAKIVESAQTLGLHLMTDSVWMAYLTACKGSQDKRLWINAVAVMDHLPARPPSPVLTECFEIVLEICEKQQKWRTALDILEKMKVLPEGITVSALRSTLLVCSAQDTHAPTRAACNLFWFMVSKNMVRDVSVYKALLRGLYLTAQYDRAEGVWVQLQKDGLVISDELFAIRIDGLSRHTSSTSRASAAYAEAIALHTTPRLSALAMYKAFVGRQRVREAERVVSQMASWGFKLPSKLLSSHIAALCNSQMYTQAASFLSSALSHSSIFIASALHSSVWNALMKGLIEGSASQELLEVYSLMKSSASLSAEARRWLPQIIDILGSEQKWRQAVNLIACEDRYGSNEMTALLIALLSCSQHELALSIAFRYMRFKPVLPVPHAETAMGAETAAAMKTAATGSPPSPSPSPSPSIPTQSSIDVSAEILLNRLQPVVVLIHQLIETDSWDELTLSLAKLHAFTKQASFSELTARMRGQVKTVLPSLFTAAAKHACQSTEWLSKAGDMMDLQLNLNIIPDAMCCRWAVEAAVARGDWESCLRLFSLRAHCSHSRVDEEMYIFAFRACTVLGQWNHGLELLAELLAECDRPGPLPLEAVVRMLLSAQQGELVIQILNIMHKRNIPRTSRLEKLIANDSYLHPKSKEVLLKKILIA